MEALVYRGRWTTKHHASLKIVYDSKPRRCFSLDRQAEEKEQNVIVRIAKSQAKVTNNNCIRGIVLLKLTADRYEASRRLSATAELLVLRVMQQNKSGCYLQRLLGNITSLSLFYISVFSCPCLTVTPLDGFLHVIAQNM